MVPVQKFIKICPVSMRDPRSLGNITTGCLEELNQILLFKLTPCLGQGQNFTLMLFNGIVEKILGDNR